MQASDCRGRGGKYPRICGREARFPPLCPPAKQPGGTRNGLGAGSGRAASLPRHEQHMQLLTSHRVLRPPPPSKTARCTALADRSFSASRVIPRVFFPSSTQPPAPSSLSYQESDTGVTPKASPRPLTNLRCAGCEATAAAPVPQCYHHQEAPGSPRRTS